MRAPDFWFRPPGMTAALLTPAGWVWAWATARRRTRTEPWRAPVPVVCVGNLVAGGAGKTPVALAVARRLIEFGARPHFLTRGYGGTEPGPLRVDPDRHRPDRVGDEPLLLARLAPTWVAGDRVAGARAAAAAGAEALVMDDGFQNPGLAKDVALVVVDGGRGFGNGRVIPAGPLREPVETGLARAAAVVLVGADGAGVAARLGDRLPLLRAHVHPGPEAESLAGRRVYAFAGIGDPHKFFDTLRDVGAEVMATRAFPDHCPYGLDDLEPLLRAAHGADALAVTTEKDAVRLPEATRRAVRVLTIAVEWENEADLDAVLAPILAPPRVRP